MCVSVRVCVRVAIPHSRASSGCRTWRAAALISHARVEHTGVRRAPTTAAADPAHTAHHHQHTITGPVRCTAPNARVPHARTTTTRCCCC
jgi:hypothetical protein